MNIQDIADLLDDGVDDGRFDKPLKINDSTLAINGFASYLTEDVSELLVYADDATTQRAVTSFVGMTELLDEEVCITFDGTRLLNVVKLLLDSDTPETATLRVHAHRSVKVIELSTPSSSVLLMQYGMNVNDFKSPSIKERVKAFNLAQPEFIDEAVGI